MQNGCIKKIIKKIKKGSDIYDQRTYDLSWQDLPGMMKSLKSSYKT